VIHTKNGSGTQQFVSVLLPLYANTGHNITKIQHIFFFYCLFFCFGLYICFSLCIEISNKDYIIEFVDHSVEIVLGNDIGIKATVN
jgi:hypothetical protein